MAGNELVLRPEEQAVHGLELAERVFTPERRAAIAQFLAISEDDPALVPYLAVCASYGLDPVMGQVWLIPKEVKVRVQDGDAEVERKVKRYSPAVGRDGLLAIARRDPRFAGLKYAVICEHDSYEVVYDGSADQPKVIHRFASKPTVFEEGVEPGRWRGKVLGAWAKCYIEGQPPQFYEASLREHGKLEQAWEWNDATRKRERLWLDDKGVWTFSNTGRPAMKWAGAWDYVSAMILKAAMSFVLRIGLGITGIVPADEIGGFAAAEGDGPGISQEAPAETEFEWESVDGPAELVERLRAAVAAANEIMPFSWSVAKCEMALVGRSPEELEAFAVQIEREVELHSARIDPSKGRQASAEHELEGQVEGEDVADAEVVQSRALTDEERGQLDVLEHRRADLLAGVEGAEVGSEEHSALVEELEQVEGQIRELGRPDAA